MEPVKSAQPRFASRLRNSRLTSTATLLATLSVGVIAGSVLTRGVSGKEQTVNSSDAHPLVIPSPSTLSNGFAQIVREAGPAVVNISTESLPKQSTNPHARRGTGKKGGENGGGNDDSQGDMQDFFNRFFGGQGGGGEDDGGPNTGGAPRSRIGLHC